MKSKVYYDIKKTAYSTEYGEFKLYFSSEANMRKFNSQIDEYIEEQSFYLYNRFGNTDNIFDDFLTIALYKRIEKRGFRVIYKENIEVLPNCTFVAELRDSYFLNNYEREV